MFEMGRFRVEFCLLLVAICGLERCQGTSLRLRNALLSSGDWLNDVDGDNIPGRAGIDYPVHSSVPKGTSFRCGRFEYAGYFADAEADCQAYHVCFPDGRNASFLCVNGTVFHQRYFVCDWWFHSNCSLAPDLYELNLYRKIPLPVLPPVRRREFPGPAPQPRVELPPPPPTRDREPKKVRDNPKNDRKENDPNEKKKMKQNNYESVPPNDLPKRVNEKPPSQTRNPGHDNDKCDCQCNSPGSMYSASSVHYEKTH